MTKTRSTYTILNVLIVNNDAGYISTQIHAKDYKSAFRELCEWVNRRDAEVDHISLNSPVFVKNTDERGSAPMQYTVRELVRELVRD